MSLDLHVLRALLRLARRAAPASPGALLDRLDADPTAIDAAIARLVSAGLVLRAPAGPRLTLAGLAVAAATIPPVAGTKKPRRPVAAKRAPRVAAVLPLVRRRSPAAA